MSSGECLVLITKKDCQKCEYVKGKIPKDMRIHKMDAESREGMGFLAYYEAFEKPVPILVDEETDEVIEGAIRIKNAISEAYEKQQVSK